MNEPVEPEWINPSGSTWASKYAPCPVYDTWVLGNGFPAESTAVKAEPAKAETEDEKDGEPAADDAAKEPSSSRSES